MKKTLAVALAAAACACAAPAMAQSVGVAGGFSKGKTHVDNSVTTEGRTTSGESSGWSDLDIGASFGLGLRYRLGRVSLSPEVRYTEWGGQPFRIVSKRQADFLFGVTF